jgi:hypothetical protein
MELKKLKLKNKKEKTRLPASFFVARNLIKKTDEDSLFLAQKIDKVCFFYYNLNDKKSNKISSER